jgi:CcmD family protein
MKRVVLVIVLLGLLPGAILGAQPPAPPAAAQEGFVPVSALPPQAEQLPAAPIVIAAYAFVWVALLAYVWLLWTRMTRLERELADLQRRVQKQ